MATSDNYARARISNIDCDLFVILTNADGRNVILGAFPTMSTAARIARAESQGSPRWLYRVVDPYGNVMRAYQGGDWILAVGDLAAVDPTDLI